MSIFLAVDTRLFILSSSVYTRVGRKVHRLKSSYNDVISAFDDFFLPMGSKNCNTDGRNESTASGSMLKNKLNLITFQESILVSRGTFQLTLVYYVFKCSYMYKSVDIVFPSVIFSVSKSRKCWKVPVMLWLTFWTATS